MKKIIFFILFCCTLILNAQEKIQFHLTQEGKFLTNDNKDFIIVPFEGKSAHEIYNELVNNIHALYNNPKEVLSTIEDESISIYAIGKVAYDKLIGITRTGMGHYSIKISIKDNKIKFELPQVQKVTFGSGSQETTLSYSYQIGTYFKKSGEPKEKRIEWIKSIEDYMISICNLIIMGDTSNNKEKEEDW